MYKKLRIVRILLAALFLIATVLCFLLGHQAPKLVSGTAKLHMAPLYLAETAGATLTWLIISLVWGRIYCSTVCPIGALQDVMLLIRRKIPALNKPFHYRKASKVRLHILILYIICLVCGLAVVPLALEPWFMVGNATLLMGESRMANIWASYGFSALWGMIFGAVALAVILPWALWRGREFCNTVCPLGTLMGCLSRRAAFRITIDGDKCTSCLICQDNCRASAINVAGRYVDNGKCVRCLECAAKCPEKAIRYTQDRNRPSTPLFMRTRRKAL